jgi:2-hydroxycyclohexanecarboxyl-CoA dehydrogenase
VRGGRYGRPLGRRLCPLPGVCSLLTRYRHESDRLLEEGTIDVVQRTVIITGAGSEHGIGRATATRLAQEGFAVALLDVDGPAVDSVARRLVESTGARALGLQVDVTVRDSIDACMEKVEAQLPPVFGLVNNAGLVAQGDFLDISIAEWDRIFDVNVRGVFQMTQRVIPLLINGGAGRIVNLSSVSGQRGRGMVGGAHYSASKAAVLGLTRSLARELASAGITVNAVAPGLIDTPMTAGLGAADGKALSRIPIGRKGTPQEVASVIAFLVSDGASYVTGATYDVNGGLHMH